MRRAKDDVPPPRAGDTEMQTLLAFLDYLRDCAVRKLDGVPEPDVRTPGVASGTNLLGLVRHLTFVERHVFLGLSPRSWPATFRARDSDTVDSVIAGYRQAVAEADEVIAAATDLGEPTRPGGPALRWALTHMIEETGRHAGHLDILRELIDGRTGR